MKLSTRVFEDKPAVREQVPLYVALAGGPGVGKTVSALRLAVGAQRVYGGDIYFIDTEGRRGLEYSEGPGDTRFKFKFRHVDFQPPYRSLDYLAAVQQVHKKGGRVIIIDSMTHEHENVGGYLDYIETELDRLSKGKEDRRSSYTQSAYRFPKFERRCMINGFNSLESIFMIFCFRAEEKNDWNAKDKDGKKIVQNIGFVPVGGKTFLYEQKLSCLLEPMSDGTPTWLNVKKGEADWLKLPEQFRKIFAERKQLSEDIGQQLAEWAKGGVSASKTAVQPATNGEPKITSEDWAILREKAELAGMKKPQLVELIGACGFRSGGEIPAQDYGAILQQVVGWDASSHGSIVVALPAIVKEARAPKSE